MNALTIYLAICKMKKRLFWTWLVSIDLHNATVCKKANSTLLMLFPVKIYLFYIIYYCARINGRLAVFFLAAISTPHLL